MAETAAVLINKGHPYSEVADYSLGALLFLAQTLIKVEGGQPTDKPAKPFPYDQFKGKKL